MDTQGQIVYFNHVISDLKAGAQLSSEIARELIETFAEEVLKVDLTDYELTDVNQTELASRRDHVFIYHFYLYFL